MSMKQVVVGRDISHIAKANKASTSGRTTVPKNVMDALDLKIGDIVEWEIHTDKGKTIAHVKKIEKT